MDDGVAWQIVGQVDKVSRSAKVLILRCSIELEQFVVGEAIHPFSEKVHLVHIQKLILQHREGGRLMDGQNENIAG